MLASKVPNLSDTIQDATLKKIRINSRSIEKILASFSIKSKDDLVRMIDQLVGTYRTTYIIKILSNARHKVSDLSQAEYRALLRMARKKSETGYNFISNDDIETMFYASVEMLKSRISAMDDDAKLFNALFVLVCISGKRISDVKTLKKRDLRNLHKDGSVGIKIVKTGYYGRIQVDEGSKHVVETVIDALSFISEEQDLESAIAGSSQAMYKNFRTHYEVFLGKKKPKGVGFHAVRYNMARKLFGKFGDENVAKTALDHSSTTMTNHYINKNMFEAEYKENVRGVGIDEGDERMRNGFPLPS